MKKYISLALCLVMALSLFAGCKKADDATDGKDNTDPTDKTDKKDAVDPTTVETMTATIKVKDMGDIVVELYPSKAPQSVSNFVELARDGFYDGLIFHRVMKDFMIQGGDPEGTGTGGPGYSIKGEFSQNGVENDILHERGVLSMARKNAPLDSAGSQFFIVHQTSPHLDGAYAAFGKVTSGMDIVDKIAEVETDAADKPVTDVVIETITVDGPVLTSPDKIMDEKTAS